MKTPLIFAFLIGLDVWMGLQFTSPFGFAAAAFLFILYLNLIKL
jgi:hypothetical protein